MSNQAKVLNIEVEQALLGAILLNSGDVLNRIENLIAAEDFSEPLHIRLYQEFMLAHHDGRAIDVTLAKAALGSDNANAIVDIGQNLTVGGYLGRLAASAVTVIGAEDYARTIRDLADKRRMLDVAETLRDCVTGGSGDGAVSIATHAIDLLDEIVSSQPRKRANTFSIRSAAQSSIDRMQWAMQNPGKITGTSWGITDLDRMTSGLQRGEVTILAGRPGMGKTALAGSSALQTSKGGNSVLIFSQEMTAQALADRALADALFNSRNSHAGKIQYFDIQRGNLSNHDAERVIDAARAFEGLPLKIDEQSSLTISQIAARARKHKQRLEQNGKTLDLLIVDHLHITKASDRYSGNRVSEVTEISGGLKALAKELHVPVMALAQLSRKVEEREDKRPMMADLRDSGSIEQDADTIIFLFREEYYLRNAVADQYENEKRIARLVDVENQLEAIVAKQRNGPVGTVTLFCDIACNAVRSTARAA